MAGRSFDVVLFGATGFTGGLTAEYLARSVPAGTRWALAGRNRGKLAGVRDRLAEHDASLAELPLLEADVERPESVRAIAADARVVITTVGPYVRYGEPLVAACADSGTDYVDLTGEPEFINTTYLRHHRRATETGARLVHACGFDSVPHDLGAYFTVQQLPADEPLRISGYVRANAAFSGGTFSSAVTAFSRGRQNLASARARKAAEPRNASRRTRYVPGRPHREPVDAGWALPLPTIDGPLVARSARAVDRYGPDFAYSHFVAVPKAWQAAGLVAGVGALLVAAQIPPARRALLQRLPAGQGPSEQKRANSWFTVTFVGEGGGHRVVTRVSGGDPGYDETAKMLAESALCLAFDDLPATSGQVTTAAAMGDALLARLQRAGIRFEVLSS
jgi:short subunit dehydrogenase-like uncharacterized protein